MTQKVYLQQNNIQQSTFRNVLSTFTTHEKNVDTKAKTFSAVEELTLKAASAKIATRLFTQDTKLTA